MVGRGHHVGQPVGAEQDRGVAFERLLDDLDVVRFVLVAKRAADVAEDFVAARMPHRVELADLPRVFPLADRRVVVGQLLDAVGAAIL